MNRRHFFGMSVAAVLAAGLPLSVLPERKYFLAPRDGLWQSIPMREVEQYLINNDALAMRWDAFWIVAGGEIGGAYVLDSLISGLQYLGDPQRHKEVLDIIREDRRKQLANMIPPGARLIVPKLPQTLYAKVTWG